MVESLALLALVAELFVKSLTKPMAFTQWMPLAILFRNILLHNDCSEDSYWSQTRFNN